MGVDVRRFNIKLGDKTTNGGVVIEGDRTTTHHGTPLSYLGAKVMCSACGSVGMIVGTGPRRPFSFMGKDAALDGDICVCKCHPAPELLASQNTMSESFETGELEAMGFGPSGKPLVRVPTGDFDERVRVVGLDGRPLCGVPYHIRTALGEIYKGVTDESGHCPRIFTEEAQQLDIALGLTALQRWRP
ncbi:PAAR domain-containing protein [Paraburkholderia azotifigens]|uniref:PAAR domain-containing protein n=1 Tax=Paraburkholderia azotifigens TaxID=2057004 RepID=UPI0031756A78